MPLKSKTIRFDLYGRYRTLWTDDLNGKYFQRAFCDINFRFGLPIIFSHVHGISGPLYKLFVFVFVLVLIHVYFSLFHFYYKNFYAYFLYPLKLSKIHYKKSEKK